MNDIAKQTMQFIDDQIAKYAQAKTLLASAMSLDLDPSAIAATVVQPPHLTSGSQPMLPMMPAQLAQVPGAGQALAVAEQAVSGRNISEEARGKMREAATKRWEKVRKQKADRARRRAEKKLAQEREKQAAAKAAPAPKTAQAQPAAKSAKAGHKKTNKSAAETPELVGAK